MTQTADTKVELDCGEESGAHVSNILSARQDLVHGNTDSARQRLGDIPPQDVSNTDQLHIAMFWHILDSELRVLKNDFEGAITSCEAILGAAAHLEGLGEAPITHDPLYSLSLFCVLVEARRLSNERLDLSVLGELRTVLGEISRYEDPRYNVIRYRILRTIGLEQGSDFSGALAELRLYFEMIDPSRIPLLSADLPHDNLINAYTTDPHSTPMICELMYFPFGTESSSGVLPPIERQHAPRMPFKRWP